MLFFKLDKYKLVKLFEIINSGAYHKKNSRLKGIWDLLMSKWNSKIINQLVFKVRSQLNKM